MSKRLTMSQLNELRVFNPWHFSAGRTFWLDFTQHSRQSMGHFGWHVNTRIPRASKSLRAYNGNTKPHEHEDLSGILKEWGYPVPTEWIKFMGAWWDKRFFDGRMAYLVAQYKERASQPKEGEEV